MTSLECVRTILIDHLSVVSQVESWPELNVTVDFVNKVYGAFFNLTTDATQSPENIIHQIQIFTSGLDGFSADKCLQSLVAYACFIGLVSRRPKVLSGSWKTLIWEIVKYSSIPTIHLGPAVLDIINISSQVEALKFITEYFSPESCPNPFLRLQILRFIRIFKCNDNTLSLYSIKPFRDEIINTLCESCDKCISPNNDEVSNVNPVDLQHVMKEFMIDIQYILGHDVLDKSILRCKQSEVTPAFLKLTLKFAFLLKEKHQNLSNQVIESIYCTDSIIVQNHLSACLTFCGLISDEYDIDHIDCYNNMKQLIERDSFLQNYVMIILDIVNHVSFSFPDNYRLQKRLKDVNNRLFYGFVKEYIIQYPSIQHLYELHGGHNPADKYRLRYFKKNVTRKFSESDSESEVATSDLYEEDNTSEMYFNDNSNSDMYEEDTTYSETESEA